MDHSQTKPGEHHENQVQPSDRSRKGENHENKPQPSDRSRKGEPNQPKSQKEKSFDEGESQEAHHEEEDSPQPKVQPKDKAHDKSPQKPVEQKHVEQKPGEQKPSEPKLAEKGSDKTFLTMGKVVEEVLPYTLHDLLFPAGKVAKLCKITDAASPSLRFGQACSRFGFEKPSPVVILSGAMESNRSKFYAGICRAAFRTDATIIDSGVKSGIEQFTLRRRVKLVGVFPESEILLPKVSPTDKQWNELSNGHTHLFMLCEHPSRSYRWNDEAEIKMKIAKQIAEGTSKVKMPKCKIVTVVMGDLENCTNDIIQSINNNLPVLIVGGSQLSNDIIKVLKGDKSPVKLPFTLLEAFKLKTAHIYCLEDNNSEEIASFLHFFLTVTPF